MWLAAQQTNTMNVFRRYGVAIGCTAFAVLIRFAMDPVFQNQDIPFPGLLCAAALASWYGGVGPGVLVTVLGLLVADFFFVPPLHTFGPINQQQLILFALFFVEGTLVSFLAARLRSALQRVRRAEQEIVAVVENSADAILSKDMDGIIRTWNRGAERIYGYSAGEVIGRSVQMLVPTDRAEEWSTIVSQLQRGESIKQHDTQRICKNGRRIDVSLTMSPVRDADGRITRISTIARDITDRKEAETALRDRERRLQAVLDAATDAIITIDSVGTIHSVNQGAEKLFEYAAGEMIGRNVMLLMTETDRRQHDGYLQRFLRLGHSRLIGVGREVSGCRKDGSEFPADLAVSEFEDGGQRMFTGILRDLSIRRSLEREVSQAATLEQQRLGQELHDTTGQELAALELLLDCHLQALETDAPQQIPLARKMLAGLQRARTQVRTIARGLLQTEVDPEQLEGAMELLAKETTSLHQVQCKFQSLNGTFVGSKMIATQLYGIARQAVSNAVRHAQCRNIDVSMKSEDHSIVLRVQDDGVGLPASGADNGGLGMKIMRYRAKLIHAQLSIGSAETNGAIVTCVLHRGVPHGPER